MSRWFLSFPCCPCCPASAVLHTHPLLLSPLSPPVSSCLLLSPPPASCLPFSPPVSSVSSVLYLILLLPLAHCLLRPLSSVFSVSSVSCLLLLLPSLPSPPRSLSPLSLPHLCFLTVYSACPISSCAVVLAAVMHSGVCGEMSLPIPSHSSVIRISGRCSLMDGGLINAD